MCPHFKLAPTLTIVIVIVIVNGNHERRFLLKVSENFSMAYTSASLIRANVHTSLLRRETSVTKVCQDSLRIVDETLNLNSFITVCKDQALQRAQQLDQELLANNGKSSKNNPLFGVPISIKDNFCTKNVLTTCGSRMLHNFIPPYDATVVSKLNQAGCIMIGKTNMDEFAMGSSCTTSYYGHAANFCKHNLLAGKKASESNATDWFMAGGSSTGSAVSVASGACFASIGTDTGGSTRQPASLNGIVGFKPTYGLISRFGLIPLAHCLDVVSILARSVDDTQLVFDAIVGQDENDLTTVDHETELISSFNIGNSLDKTTTTIRIGIPEEFINKGDISEEVSAQYYDILERISNNNIEGNLKFEIVKLELPHSSLATECYTIISSAEIASNMSCYDGVKYGFSTNLDESQKFDRDQFYKSNRDEGLGAEVKKRILLGNYFLLENNRDRYLVQALKLRRLISEEFNRAFVENRVDVIMTPSTPTTSVSYAEWQQKRDYNKLFHEDYFLIPSNLANLPSISLPCGTSNKGLPIGLQLVANKFHDLDLLSISKLFETCVLKET